MKRCSSYILDEKIRIENEQLEKSNENLAEIAKKLDDNLIAFVNSVNRDVNSANLIVIDYDIPQQLKSKSVTDPLQSFRCIERDQYSSDVKGRIVQ